MINRKRYGFTIVELLIVIVVIAILAAITVVAYNGIQNRANDTKIRSAAAQIEKALKIYNTNTGQQPVYLGYGSTRTDNVCSGGSGGWVGRTTYTSDCTLERLLQDENLLPYNFTYNLPGNKVLGASNGARVFMLYPCGTNRFMLMWYLINPTVSETSNYNTQTSSCGLNGASYKTAYGMQAAQMFNF